MSGDPIEEAVPDCRRGRRRCPEADVYDARDDPIGLETLVWGHFLVETT
jgi:hypothetical protein